jgi:hypothetical protein
MNTFEETIETETELKIISEILTRLKKIQLIKFLLAAIDNKFY